MAVVAFRGGIHAIEQAAHSALQFEHKAEENIKSYYKKLDARLFEDLPLYCEGMERPTCRGCFHMLATMILPFVMWFLVSEANGNRRGEIAAIVYVTSNMWSYGVSAMYHIGRCWSARTEILLQKLDHAGIAVFAAGKFYYYNCCQYNIAFCQYNTSIAL